MVLHKHLEEKFSLRRHSQHEVTKVMRANTHGFRPETELLRNKLKELDEHLHEADVSFLYLTRASKLKRLH